MEHKSQLRRLIEQKWVNLTIKDIVLLNISHALTAKQIENELGINASTIKTKIRRGYRNMDYDQVINFNGFINAIEYILNESDELARKYSQLKKEGSIKYPHAVRDC